MNRPYRRGPSGPDPDELIRQVHDAHERAVATNEILAALGRAGADPAGILDTIAERALLLCRAQTAQVYLVDDDVIRLSRVAGDMPEEFRRYLHEHPLARDRSTLSGRVVADKQVQQIEDVLGDATYGRHDLQRLAGYRTLLSAPMLLDDQVVGLLSVWRTDVEPFDDAEVETLGVFAVQAAVALRQVDLLAALEARREELAHKVAQLEALRALGEAVSSTLLIDEVLQRVVTNAVRLTGADGGSIMEYDESAQAFSVRTAYGTSTDLLRRLRDLPIHRDSTFVGRAALARRTAEIADLAAVERDPHLELLYQDGWRSLLAVPMLRRDQMVGALVIRRRTVGAFPPAVHELVQTFAGQSALAVVNARLFRELETKSAELEVASRHKSEFLASMSHELRTPLNAVIGFSEVLLDKLFGDLNERQEEYLRDIWQSGRHLLELLNEILDLSKVEAGQMVLEPTTFPVAAALEYALALMRERAAAHRISLRLDVAGDLDTVEADELRFKQVALNLVSNAVKFTPDGGEVTVAARRAGEQLLVTVADTGVGVAPEDRERIFESFQQGPREAPKAEGTGLGLTLSRRMVELLGGRLWLESEPGVGSSFSFTVPLPHPDGAAPVPEQRDAGQRTVVVVDDDRASLDLMTAYLTGSSVRVVTARDGEVALRLVRRVVPDAVVLDIRLPHKDGWEVLAELKADPRTAAVPVVVASIVDDRPRGLALGAVEYLLKPIRRDDLYAALHRLGALDDDDLVRAGGAVP